jgi:glycyl-tRNA synthetase beta chain
VRKDFLLEIGCENIPSGYIRGALDQLESLFSGFLEEERIPHESLYVTGTPNRLVIHIKGLVAKQEAKEERVIGPPARVALTADGGYTKAAEGFAKSQGVSIEQIARISTEKGEYIAIVKRVKGRSTGSLLAEKVPAIIDSVKFPKVMRWDSSGQRFARPIRWLLALYGDRVLKVRLGGGLTSGRKTRISPFFEDWVEVGSITEYYKSLESRGIVLDSMDRRSKVLASARRAAGRCGGVLVEDENLVDVVANLLESPVPLVGKFDAAFLELPREVVVTALKSHQRYFSVSDESGRLKPIFVAFADGIAGNKREIIRGYERVLQARLADAEFYFREDTARSLGKLSEKLEGIVWLERLGTLAQKAERIERLGHFIADHAGAGNGDLRERLSRAARLAKADLASEMVRDGKEFTLLQGYIGREYAKASGEDPEVAEAIFEHYLPRFAGDSIPTTGTGAILAVADKIDTVTGCFMIGLEPTGSQDPYALRRQAVGLLRILMERRLAVPMSGLIEACIALFIEERITDISQEGRRGMTLGIRQFIDGRLNVLLRDAGHDYDLVQAVLSAPWEYAFAPSEMVPEMQRMREGGVLAPFVLAMKRIINILPGDLKGPVGYSEGIDVLNAFVQKDEERLGFTSDLFGEQSEMDLYNGVSDCAGQLIQLIERKEFSSVFAFIERVVPAINAYFDAVLVNCEDEAVRSNRHRFLSSLRTAFGVLCDFSAVAGE